MHPITIKDVAALAGVSPATASRVMTGHPSTSANTRERVRAAAAELKFRPNARARSLRSLRTNVVGLLVSDVRNAFFAELAHSIEQAALAAGYSLILGNANESEAQQNAFLENLIDQRVDGVIVAPQGGGEPLKTLLAREVPTIFVDRVVAGFDVPSVTTDSRPGIQQTVVHLVAQGHRRIGLIAGPLSISTGRQRYEIFQEAIESAGLELDDDLICFGNYQSESGSLAAQELLSISNPPTAIIAADSPMAIGALSTIKASRLQLGQDIALVAFDDNEWFSLFETPISAITHDVASMGARSMDLLGRVISGEKPESIALPSMLIVRESSDFRLGLGSGNKVVHRIPQRTES